MKKVLIASLLAGPLTLLPSCTTTYDAYGRPVQSVDPAAATAAAVAAGVVGYAIGENNDNDHYNYRRGYRPPPPPPRRMRPW